MKFFKSNHFQISCYLVLLIGIAFTACKDSSTSALEDVEVAKETTLTPTQNMESGSFVNSTISSNIVIDDFTSGAGTFVGSGQSSKFEYHESTTVLGGAREIYLRDAASGTLGGATYATIDTDASTLKIYTIGRAAAENSVMYGTAIGTVFRSWAPSPNQGAGSELNLELTLDDFILIEVAPSGTNSTVGITLRSGNGGVYSTNFSVEVGSNLIPLLDFPNITEAAAADIDGIAFSSLNTFSSFSIKNAAPEEPINNVYVSDSSVQTWDPIYPDSEDKSWSSTVCYQSNDFGLTASWSNPHNAFEVTQDNGQPHPWDNSTFDAAWINSYNDMDSQGPGGHNWSKYETNVSGTGDFVIQLLADNCSWVYLADENGDNAKLIGYQPAVSTPGEYGVTLSGNHTLTFVIFDGGGLAGGKFRLETTENPLPPIVTNAAPIADAGSNQTLDATGQTTAVALNGSGSSDPDGDALTYSWTLNGNEVSTSATPSLNLADGSYTLTLTVSDGEDTDSDDVTVTVVNTVPIANAGVNQILEATGPTTSVTLSGSATDADGDALTYSWSNGANGTSVLVNLPVGVHTFTFTATDGQGATDDDDVTVTIKDTTSPIITFNQEVGSLWPPNHKMVLVATGIAASDIVDGSTGVTVTVSSNESSNGKGDGNTDSDYEVVNNPDGSYDVYVRSERSGKGKGRTYTISMNTTDAAGNNASDSFEVVVDKSQGRTK